MSYMTEVVLYTGYSASVGALAGCVAYFTDKLELNLKLSPLGPGWTNALQTLTNTFGASAIMQFLPVQRGFESSSIPVKMLLPIHLAMTPIAAVMVQNIGQETIAYWVAKITKDEKKILRALQGIYAAFGSMLALGGVGFTNFIHFKLF